MLGNFLYYVALDFYQGIHATIHDKRNAFSLQQKEAVLVAFRISEQRELKKFRTLETEGELSYISPALW